MKALTLLLMLFTLCFPMGDSAFGGGYVGSINLSKNSGGYPYDRGFVIIKWMLMNDNMSWRYHCDNGFEFDREFPDYRFGDTVWLGVQI